MEYVAYPETIKVQNSPYCAIWEYPMENKEMSVCVAQIHERYPTEGFLINEACSEIGYILKGSGKLVTEHKSADLHEGDIIYIPNGERFYWEGPLTMVCSCTPAWYPEQHKEVE